jgi:hypothetical protein
MISIVHGGHLTLLVRTQDPTDLPQLLVVLRSSCSSNKIIPCRARVVETHHDKTRGTARSPLGPMSHQGRCAYQAQTHCLLSSM